MPSKLREDVSSTGGDGLAISRIRIENLFGRYSYDLRSDESSRESSSLLILYGDNGCGKTTLLRLVFNLLSHVEGQGHKTYLAQTRFKRLEVYFGKKAKVLAVRKGSRMLGSYSIFVTRGKRNVGSIHFKANKDNEIVGSGEREDRKLVRLLRALAGLKLSLFFVTDDRQLLRNIPPAKRPGATGPSREAGEFTGRRIVGRVQQPLAGKYLDRALVRAMRITVAWIKEQVLSGSKEGEAGASTIYTEIVRRLATTPPVGGSSRRSNLNKLITTLRQEAVRSAEFAKFGFPSALKIGDLVKSLDRAKYDRPIIQRIVEPFVESTRAKLDALQGVLNAVSGFVRILNSFFKDKRVEFDLKNGIFIEASGGAILEPTSLSSGEKQLLLLFCSILVIRHESTIFLIDEPEISLNIKWQRNLIKSLLEATKSRHVQFILATHSFELIAPHQNQVLTLS
jgi:energy-coupling factor transporter ATP-binding protein EcfA2